MHLKCFPYFLVIEIVYKYKQLLFSIKKLIFPNFKFVWTQILSQMHFNKQTFRKNMKLLAF